MDGAYNRLRDITRMNEKAAGLEHCHGSIPFLLWYSYVRSCKERCISGVFQTLFLMLKEDGIPDRPTVLQLNRLVDRIVIDCAKMLLILPAKAKCTCVERLKYLKVLEVVSSPRRGPANSPPA